MIDSKHARAVVISRRDVSSDLWIVHIRPEQQVTFLPGQYLTIGLPDGARLVERPYSVASSPAEPDLEFFLELVPGGQLTPQLYNVPVGGEVLIRPAAKGRFLFDRSSGHRNHFLVATVTGVAPFLSMLREMASRVTVPYRVALLDAASVSRELAYLEELTALAGRSPWLDYIPTISRPWLEAAWRGEVGRADDLARKYLDSLGFTPAETTAYACGNPNMVENVKGIFQRAGFPKDSIKHEVFWLAEKGD
jgi:ferredoxin--NADP+ reductase